MISGDATVVEVLKLLKGAGDELLSGQKISEELKISRTAVWKQIARLKEMGFEISSARSKGYALSCAEGKEPFNAVEVLCGLDTDFVAQRISFHDSLVSTNTAAMELAASGAPQGCTVIADSQTGGKGRLGRQWLSPPGVNLYTSIILRPQIAPVLSPPLTLVFAVAVAETISKITGKTPSVKWPNDILIGTKKVAGILTEISADIDRISHVVCGIGVNINLAPEGETGKGLNAVSVSEMSGAPVSRALFARALYSSVEKWYKVFLKGGFASVAGAWRGYFNAEGKSVSIEAHGRTIKGICMGIDEAGALLIRKSSGEVMAVTSGDMSVA